jgi:predicted nuclease of predicted toxin-antitoxin system
LIGPSFLLDENVDPALVGVLGERDVAAVALRDWHKGRHLAAPDEVILRLAREERLTLVTFDVRMIPLLRSFAESGEDHSGVVLVSSRRPGPGSLGVLASGLERAVEQYEDRTNLVLFLRASV